MELEYRYWYFQKALSEKTCDDIMYVGKKSIDKTALVGDLKIEDNIPDKKLQEVKKVRNTNIAWLEDRWIYDFVHPYIHRANKIADWNFDWEWSEAFQYTIYNKNQFYDWHCDSFKKPYSEGSFKGYIRKLSATISLNSPDEYEGGNLEFSWFDGKKIQTQVCEEILPRGSIVIFPSFVHHRVTPVTRGTRYSLVLWSLGKPFK